VKNIGTILVKNKKLTILLIVLFLNGLVYAIDTGLSIGINQSQFSGKKTATIPGFSIGGSLQWPVNSFITVQNGFELHTKGCRINTIGDIYLNNIFVYIESPVLFKVRLAQINPKLFFILGPSFNLNVLAINDVGLIDEIRKWDVDLIAGIGVGLEKISFSLRISRGLAPFDLSEPETKLRHRSVSTVVTFLF